MSGFWQKALVYFGLAEDEQYEDFEEEEDYDDYYDQATPAVRKIDRYPDVERANRATSLRSVPPHVRVHIVEPRSFNDAQQIADKFKANIPVIMNLQLIDPDLSKRLIDFTSGLTYGLDGGMQRVAEKVFLLTPSNVEVSEAEKRKLKERGLFNPY